MQTKRTNGSTTYNYVYNGSQLVQMTVGSHKLEFFYDASGAPVVVLWNGTPYYYVTSLQGDVVLILDNTGELVVSYDYDAWGNILATGGSLAPTLGAFNPLRYRGYVYDAETELYYLQSRYYNPEWGRFLNADTLVSTGQGNLGNNMFAYCLNSPISYVDPGGNFSCAYYDNDVTIAQEKPGFSAGSHKPYRYDPSVLLINGQNKFAGANDSCGLGTYADNGCGMIAIYNAMALYGRPQDLDVITTEFFLLHGMILFGLGGTGPWSIDSYFDWHRIPHTGYCDYDSLLQNVSDGDIVVFTVMNSQSDLSQGFHTMAAQYNNGAFTVYNRYSNTTTPCTLTTLNTVYRDSLWIYGYILK